MFANYTSIYDEISSLSFNDFDSCSFRMEAVRENTIESLSAAAEHVRHCFNCFDT